MDRANADTIASVTGLKYEVRYDAPEVKNYNDSSLSYNRIVTYETLTWTGFVAKSRGQFKYVLKNFVKAFCNQYKDVTSKKSTIKAVLRIKTLGGLVLIEELSHHARHLCR